MPDQPKTRVGIFLSLESEHWHGILHGLAALFRQHPSVHVLKLPRPARFSAPALRALRLDGVITRVATRADERALLAVGVPVINISGRLSAPRLTTVSNDDAKVGELAFGHFHRRGYRHFAYCGVAGHNASRLRGGGYAQAVFQAAGLHCEQFILPKIEEGDVPPEARQAGLAAWLRTLPKPLAVFCFNDAIAYALATVCVSIPAIIPDDVAILGVDNDDTQLEFSTISLSSIELNRREIGSLAGRTLIKQLQSRRKSEPVILRVPPCKIVTRRSTDKLAVNDPVVADALDYIREHLGNPLYVEEIAKAVGVSRRSLEMRFTAVVNSSVYTEVQRQQIERAVELLAATPRMTIAEIAYAAGFQDTRHLALVFRKKLGMTPREYCAKHE